MSKTLQIGLIVILTLATIFVGRKAIEKYNHHNHETIITPNTTMEISEEHCRMMPDMTGCEIYNLDSDMTGMDHANMITSIESYLFEMIPHHEEAVESSQLFLDKTVFLGDELDPLQIIAQNIVSGQTVEITELKNWIADQYSGSSYVAMYMPMMRDTSRINDIGELHNIYAEDMINHHQGAIDMSRKLLALMEAEDKVIRVTEEGMRFRNTIKSFASNVISLQEKEIKALQDILSSSTIGLGVIPSHH